MPTLYICFHDRITISSSTTLLLYYSITLLLYSITLLLYYSTIALLLYYSTTLLLLYYSTIFLLLYYSTTLLLYYYFYIYTLILLTIQKETRNQFRYESCSHFTQPISTTLLQSKMDTTLHCSRVVPHPSTERAQTALTSVIGREPVHYG